MRAAGGGVEHLAVDGIVSLSGIKPFGGAPSALACAAQVEKEQQNRCGGQDQAQRFARRAVGEEARCSTAGKTESAAPLTASRVTSSRPAKPGQR